VSGRRVDLAVVLETLPRVGSPTLRESEVEVSEQAIRTWCSAIGEDHPVHHDPAAARRAGLPGVIAPPAMMQTWTAPIGRQAGAGSPTLHARIRALAAEAGFEAVVATDYEQEYLRPVRPGDRLSERSWVEAVSERKATTLGPGHFVTIAFEFCDQRGEPVGRMRARTLYFAPDAIPPRPAGEAAQRRPAREHLSAGMDLPPLEVPLTRTLIVTASLASNDHEPVHHDHEVARRQGLDDIIVSIVTTAGLVTRYIGARAGSPADLRRLSLRLAQPAMPGDVLTLHGRSGDGRDGREVWVRGAHDRGTHVTAVAVLDPPAIP
jgi:acyl dehydratase